MSNQTSIKEIYVLAGPPESGKTTTLNYLASKVSAHYNLQPLSPDPIMQYPFDATGKSIDRKYAFAIPGSGGTVIVGISSAGDDEESIIAGFDFFDDKHCEICFIASRTWGKVFDKVKNEATVRSAICERIRMASTVDKQAREMEEHKMAQELFSRI